MPSHQRMYLVEFYLIEFLEPISISSQTFDSKLDFNFLRGLKALTTMEVEKDFA